MRRTLIFFLIAFTLAAQENPRSRRASIYPHPADPTHLEAYQVDFGFTLEHKHLFWTSKEAYANRSIQIQQQRPKGGWWVSQNRTTDVNGRLVNELQLDSTWPQHVLVLLMDGRTQIASFEVDVPSKSLKKEFLVRD
jgi:hypothetical protein